MARVFYCPLAHVSKLGQGVLSHLGSGVLFLFIIILKWEEIHTDGPAEKLFDKHFISRFFFILLLAPRRGQGDPQTDTHTDTQTLRLMDLID